MYEIKVLSDKDFFEVAKSDERYSYVDESNLGFADREKGVAYVRQTGVHDLNKYLISHELEELEHDESTHEDPNGIRHKKFFSNILDSILSPLKMMMPIANILSFPFRAAAQGPTKAFQSIFSGFGGGGGEQQQQQYNADSGVFSSFQPQFDQSQSSGAYSPQQSNVFTSGAYATPGTSLFSGSGGYTPQTVPQAAQGSYTPSGIGVNNDEDIPEYIRQQQFGRLQF